MSIPLFGLVHKIDTFTLAESDDGAGGIAVTVVASLTKVRCRVTVLKAEDAQKDYGLDSERLWKIIAKKNSDIVEGHFIQLSSHSKEAPIDRVNLDGDPIYFRVLRAKKQIDHNGHIHHLALVIEEEAIDT